MDFDVGAVKTQGRRREAYSRTLSGPRAKTTGMDAPTLKRHQCVLRIQSIDATHWLNR